jgi:uncharacterized protein (DUF849 family)
MSREVIITCAVTGAGDTVSKNPYVPVTPAEIAAAVAEAAREGAAIAHIHVRNPRTGLEAWDRHLFREVVARCRDLEEDIILNLTTGFGAEITPPTIAGGVPDFTDFLLDQMERLAHVEELLPEICSLDCGTTNFGDRAIFVNSPNWLELAAERLQTIGVKPELEVFELGHIRFAQHLMKRGKIARPPLFQICLGIPWAAPATSETMVAMRQALPPGVEWSGFGIGRHQMPMALQAALLGGNVRVGLEDCLFIDKAVPASNGQLVRRVVELLRKIGSRPATAAEARQRLQLGAVVSTADVQ